MARIYITETQFNKLFGNKTKLIKEYLDSSFDWNTFNNIKEPKERIRYCREKLDKCLGSGNDRTVFEVDDYSVLKVANNKSNNIPQNKNEYEITKQLKSNPLLPKIYGHADDFSWLWTEKVIPATQEDFEKILGIKYDAVLYDPSKNKFDGEYNCKKKDALPIKKPYYTEYDDEDKEMEISLTAFLRWYVDYEADFLYDWNDYETETFKEWLKHPWFQHLTELMEYQYAEEFHLYNFGITMRDNKPTIVVLDIGWTK